ncbi:MerR family transcriptional regulator [Nocardia sp. NPDC050710]|uniref:MerR family transcriptional regulator n=1 Tax=Nocardia sp. NPDC050710 TaxID=3157220 RepID=UPI0033E53111
MLIGELAARTGVSSRLLRYYEEQGLLHPQRDANGYRCYSDDAPDRVAHIRDLLAAGLPTEDIRLLMPCYRGPNRWVLSCEESITIVDKRAAELEQKIAELNRQRELLRIRRELMRNWPDGEYTTPAPSPR